MIWKFKIIALAMSLVFIFRAQHKPEMQLSQKVN